MWIYQISNGTEMYCLKKLILVFSIFIRVVYYQVDRRCSYLGQVAEWSLHGKDSTNTGIFCQFEHIPGGLQHHILITDSTNLSQSFPSTLELRMTVLCNMV